MVQINDSSNFISVVVCFLYVLHNLRHVLDVWNLLQLSDDVAYIFAVVDAQLDGAVEDTFFAGDGKLVDVDIHLR